MYDSYEKITYQNGGISKFTGVNTFQLEKGIRRTLALSESASDEINYYRKGDSLPSFLYRDKLRFKKVKMLLQKEG